MTDETEITKEPASEQEEGNKSDVETERRLIPDPEEAEDRWFRELVQRLDDEDAKEEFQGDEGIVEDTEDRLVEQFASTFRYYIYRRIIPIMLVTIILGVLIDRFIQPVPIQAYGLVANLVGTTILALNTTRGRYMIANLSLPQEEQTTALRESYARQTAITTAGLGAFLLGFGIQLVGVLLAG